MATRHAEASIRRIALQLSVGGSSSVPWRGLASTSKARSLRRSRALGLGVPAATRQFASGDVAYRAQEAESYQAMREPFGLSTLQGMLASAELPENFRMLDGGCGIGQHCRALAQAFPGAALVGVDSSPDMVSSASASARKKGLKNITFQEGDVTSLPFEAASFDVVLLSQVLHHLPLPVRDNYAAALEEAKRVLKPGGLLLVVATRWTQRRHSYWTFKLMPEATWQKLADNDRWTCFERTALHPKTLTQVIHGMGFKQSDMVIPKDSHWTASARNNVEAALTPEWRATEGCFAYMTHDEQGEFMREVERLVAEPREKARLLAEVEARRELYGEGTVYSFTRLSEDQLAQQSKEAATYHAQNPKPQSGHMGWVNLVSGCREPLQVLPLSQHVGAVVKNVDLSNVECRDQIRQAMWDFGTVLIPSSEMCFKPRSHLELSKLWGPVEEYHPINPQHHEEPMVQLLPTCGEHCGPDSFLWHNDMSWRPMPSAGGQLCGMVVPPYGGATRIVNTNAVFESLDKDLQEVLLQMTGHNDLEVGYSRVNRPKTYETNPEGYKRDSDKHGGDYQADHPAVICHYATGKPHLFVNPNFTVGISGAGLSERECEEIFARVTQQLDRPEFQATINWQEVEAGTIAAWDNWAVMHIAPADYAPHYRLMHRTVTLGPGRPERYVPRSAGQPESEASWGSYVAAAYKEAGFQKGAAVAYYEKSAHLYDKLARPSIWLAPHKVAAHAQKFLTDLGMDNVSSLRTLDFGAGTGQLGVALKQQGFQSIDAVEPSANMVDMAPENTYGQVYGSDSDVAPGSYDVVASTGVIGTHVDPSGLWALLSRVKVGGVMVFSCKACSWQQDGFGQMMDRISSSWSHRILFGPAPLNKDMPDQKHVIVSLVREA